MSKTEKGLTVHETLTAYKPSIVQRSMTAAEFAVFKQRYAEARLRRAMKEPTKMDFEVRDFAFKFGIKASMQKYRNSGYATLHKVQAAIMRCAKKEWDTLVEQ